MPNYETKILEFEVARSNRQFEIQMFWQRSNYFLALTSAVGVGFFAVDNELFSFLLACFGLSVAVLWYRTNLGARYWQVFWEAEVHEIAKQLDIEAFALTDDEIFRRGINFGSQRNKSLLRKFVDKQVQKKPSVSYNMILLSIIAAIGWVLIIVSILVKFASKHVSSCNFTI